MNQLGEAVALGESEYEYDGGCGFDPVLWLPASAQVNDDNLYAHDLGPHGQPAGTWSGSTTQRNVMTEWTLGGDDRLLTNAITPSNSFAAGTIVCRFRTSSDQGSSYSRLCGVGARGDGLGLHLRGNEGKISWYCRQGGSTKFALVSAAATYFDGQVHHVVGLWRTNYARWFVDGVKEAGTDTSCAYSKSSLPGTIGADSGGADFVIADVLEFAYFDEELSDAQAVVLYESSLDGSPGVMARPIGPEWFPPEAAPGVTAPTAVLAGPLVGPLGGPI